MMHTKSEANFETAKRLLPGGVNSPVRAFQSVNTTPLFVESGKGSKLTDVDGNVYIDYICSWGPLILGHASEVVYSGVNEYLLKGTTYGVPTAIEVEMAALINEAYPSMEMLRLVSSGTEATMSAIRAARGYTGREKILKFEGCYHGHSDSLLVKSGSGTLTYGVPTSAGVTKGTAQDTLVGKFNDLDMLKEILNANQGSIAAVIVEPIPGNMGLVLPNIEFLRSLRSLTQEHGIVLIFDEVITGFRVDYLGAQGLYDIQPDMTCLGKIIGGGLPVGAYGGKKAIMECIAPLGPVYQAGTLSGNPIAMKMGMNLITYLKEHQEIYEELDQKGKFLEDGFQKNIQKTGIRARVNRVKGMLCLFFTEGEVDSYDAVMRSDTQQYAAYFNGMLERGILLPPAQFECLFLSHAHTYDDLEATINMQLEVFKQMCM
ncbi:MAG: glutamate-1-semialdehyde-2,1-aminomutase [Firmicutes bacterium HGW-Firmicutes-1]|jgi:glutamate-1-semialdehyde 2,1-aminomutase|nr:MAG: glutamate-1-semialdehyde-2,1-aminomutase [Firmicutes bacterium HGW-Firmicutes-1]